MRASLRATIAVSRVELLRLLRSPTSFTLLLLVPALQILLFGYAVRPSSADVSVAIAGPPEGQNELAALAKDAGLRIVARNLSPGGARAMVRSGEALIGIELPAGEPDPVRAVIDASDPNLTAVAEEKISAIYWRTLAEQNGPVDGVPPLRLTRMFNPDARADWAFLPALIGTIMMISMLMLGTLSMAREREIGTWEALAALPIGRMALLVGKSLPLALVGTAQGAIVLTLSAALFGLPVRGSIAALIALFPLFAIAHVILGQALAARARTQMEALQGAVAFYLPAMLLSGFLYPFATLPGWAQYLGSLFPLTHFIRASREATLRGAEASAILIHGLPITLFLAAALLAAFTQYRARLD